MSPACFDDHVPFIHMPKGSDVLSQMSLLVPSVRPNADEELAIRSDQLKIHDSARAHHDGLSTRYCPQIARTRARLQFFSPIIGVPSQNLPARRMALLAGQARFGSLPKPLARTPLRDSDKS